MQIGNIEFKSPLMLSPMAGFTILPFRVCVRQLGGLSFATTDFVNARSILEFNPKAMRMISSCPQDRPLGVQLFGANPQELRDAAVFLEDLGIDLIDVNLGCPAPKVNRVGAGAALMKDEELTEELVQSIVDAVKIPVTVKMRLGWDENNMNAPTIAKNLEEIGVAAVAVHGRTAAQGYTGNVNLEGIKSVVQAVKRIPVIGNGDVSTHHDAKKMLTEVGVSAVMVGRAALRDPFFFQKTAKFLETGIEPVETTLNERILFMHKHFATSVHFMGEENACIYFRTVIPGYSEFFPNKKDWVKVYHELEPVQVYLDSVKLYVPKECSQECRQPDLKRLLQLPLRENEMELV